MPHLELPSHELVAANGAVVDKDNIGVRSWPSTPTGEDDRGPFQPLETEEANRLPEVVIYEHINFGGRSARTNLAWYYVGDWWNDRISSIVVTSGTWRFYEHWHYEGRYWDLRPGYYDWVVAAGIRKDSKDDAIP